MKIILRIIGVIVALVGATQSSLYVRDYNIITSYGQGFVWGSVILTVLGIVMIVVSFRVRSRR